ncbi:MAG: N-acetyltransferase [Desulfobacteraceae bacterium]|nr:N-acetyltransferase [Desulfobacteraceae bacterium]
MIRKATIEDVKSIHAILKYYGDRDELLSRPLSKLYDHLRDFSVYTHLHDGKAIVGCCALQFCWEDLAEIRSLAVVREAMGKSIGRQLVENAFVEARQYKIKSLFTLTYKPAFFEKFGFVKIDKADLPIKIWSDCIQCVKFPDCDETAMIRSLE